MILQQSILIKRAPAQIPFNNSRGKQFSPSFAWRAQRREAQKPEVTFPSCIYNTRGKKGLCTWMSDAMGNDIPSHSPRDPSSACSMMLPSIRAQLTSTTSSVYPQYWSVVVANLPTKPDLDSLRWAQIKPWHQCHHVFAVGRSWKFWPGDNYWGMLGKVLFCDEYLSKGNPLTRENIL